MKIRTDFVTNSSSSSFVVSLRVELSDGVTLNFGSSEYGGDFESTGASFSATGKNGEQIYCKNVEPQCDDPWDGLPYEVTEMVDLGPGTVDMLSISEAKNVGTLITAIKKPFLGTGHYEVFSEDEEEEEYEFEDESAREIIENTLTEFNQMVDDCDKIMNEHIKSVSDVKKVVVEYEFGGRGEFLAGPDEILNKLFGWDDGNKIYDTIQKNDAKDAAETLKKMDCLKNVDAESVDEFVAFVNECDCTPDECTIVVSVNEDGQLHYSIDYSFNE